MEKQGNFEDHKHYIMVGRIKRAVWIWPLAIAGLVAVLGWWGNGQLRDTIETQLRAQLSATLRANVTALEVWSTNQTRLATSLADDSAVRTVANEILQLPRPERRELEAPRQLQRFSFILRNRLPALDYEVAHLITTDYVVVANSRRPVWGANPLVSDAHTNKFAQLFASGEPVIITPFKPELLTQQRRNSLARLRMDDMRDFVRPSPREGRLRRGDVTMMQVAAPLRDNDDKIIGALALIINPDREFSRILSVARSGLSGETYAFDQTGLLISHSRFDDQLKELGLIDRTNASSALNLHLYDPGGDLTKGFRPDTYAHPLTRLVANAVDEEHEVEVNPSRDYRGVLVVGASRWLPQFGFGVATQIDAAEAYRPLRVLQSVFEVLFLFLLLCATGLFVFSYSNLIWQRRLSQAQLKLRELGQYTLEEKIGEGGMGAVYRARHALLRRDTAVKLLLPDRANAVSIARFEREVRLTCQLSHPNTIQIYDYGHTPDGIFYYAMEFLRGLNLHQLVARFGPQSEGRVIHILTQVCDSLAEAHAIGLIHRDIKPANVFLCRRGGVADWVKVLDFGLVREYSNGEISHRDRGDDTIEGTPLFMPPEAINSSGTIDPRSDLYSVGALGYYLLTGQYIFEGETIPEIHKKQMSAAPIPPSQRTSQPISRELEELLLSCVAKQPEARPPSANELRARLLACPAAGDWTPKARAEWWDAYEQQLLAAPGETAADASTPLVTVRIDLASRGQQ